MDKDTISDRQSITLIILFLIGTASIQVMGLEAKQDLWLATIISVMGTIPLLVVYSSILNKYPGKDFFQICEIYLGRFAGKGVNILFVWYFFHAGSSVLRNYYQFVITTSLDKTPEIIVMISIFIFCIWLVKLGIEVMGRWAFFLLALLIIFGMFSTTLLIENMNFNNLKPILSNGLRPIIEGAFSVFSFPFGELIVFTLVLPSLQESKSKSKVYITGLIIGGILLLIISLTSVLVLGVDEASNSLYPSYRSITRLEVADFLHGLEIVAASLFSIGAFIKICIYLLATCKGVQNLFGYKGYKFLVTPISLLMINLAYFMHDNIIDYYEWNDKVWKYYAFPFQVILPVIIFLITVIKTKNKNTKTKQNQL